MTNADDALAAAEAAEAEAAEAEAVAAAARARAKAIRLRQEADVKAAEKAAASAETAEAEIVSADTADVAVSDAATVEVASSAVELDEPTVTVSDTVPDDAPADAPKKRRPRIGGGVWKVAAATLLVIGSLALLAISGGAYIHHRNVEKQQEKAAEFAAAARQGVVTLMSLDFNRAQEDVQRIIDITTGDFKKDFENQAEDFVKVAQESKVVTEATVNAVAVQKMTDDTATVLLAAMSRVSNIASDKQEPRAWRLSVDVARDGDQLKLAKVEFVP